jgi:hypothetical protein
MTTRYPIMYPRDVNRTQILPLPYLSARIITEEYSNERKDLGSLIERFYEFSISKITHYL